MTDIFKTKLKTLRSILNEQAKLSKMFDMMTCYIEGDLIIIEKEKEKTNYNDLVTKIPTDDMDDLIIRERAKLFQEKKSNDSYNKLEQGIENAVNELELKETLKEIVK